MTLELNIDLGELADEPDALYALATVVNVACGGHAGDDASMQRAVALAKASGARVAAHPSYSDREGFGRRARFASADETARSVADQCRALERAAREASVAVEMLKLHGALYHDTSSDPLLAEAVLGAAVEGLPALRIVVGPPGGALEALASARGLAYQAEGFADRRYTDRGELAPRSEPGALLALPALCVEQALRLARSGRFATLCLHSDTPGAVENARAVRTALVDAGFVAGAR